MSGKSIISVKRCRSSIEDMVGSKGALAAKAKRRSRHGADGGSRLAAASLPDH